MKIKIQSNNGERLTRQQQFCQQKCEQRQALTGRFASKELLHSEKDPIQTGISWLAPVKCKK
jgi:hypothetical protein